MSNGKGTEWNAFAECYLCLHFRKLPGKPFARCAQGVFEEEVVVSETYWPGREVKKECGRAEWMV